WERDLTAAWLAAALSLMRQEREAEQLIARMRFDDQATTRSHDQVYNDAMTRDGFLLFIIARHFPQRVADIPATVMSKLAQRVTDGVYHSLSAGATLLALDAYASATDGVEGRFRTFEVLQDHSVRALPLPDETFPKSQFSERASALRFLIDSDINAYYLIEQTGFDRTPPTEAIRQGLEVVRAYTDENGAPLANIRMGDEVYVRLKFRTLDKDFLQNIALVDLLPGGFELVVPREEAHTPFLEAGEDADATQRGTGWRCQICAGPPNMQLQYADMREDRVVFYVSAGRDMSEIVYRIKATNVGEYVVPPAYGEALYDRSVMGRSAAKRVSVSRP
ncbi:MAG TPA: hypothetical protein VK025_10040, partial [Steroidobacter sp.]|nr:hypothetical protein [Steroidobacter sp.]